jgi:hypothetical protein
MKFSDIRNKSQKKGKLKRDSIDEMYINTYIDDLWKRISDKLKSKGVKERDIDKVSKKVRESSRQIRKDF